VEWSDKIPKITQNSIPMLGYGWIHSKFFEEFLCKMMRLVKILAKEMDGYEWMNLGGGFLI